MVSPGSSVTGDPSARTRSSSGQRHAADLRGWDSVAHVRVCARERQARFELHVAPHRRTRVSSLGVLRRELDGREPRAEKVGLEAHDDPGSIESEMRDDGSAEAGGVAAANRSSRRWFVQDVLEPRIAVGPAADDVTRRRTAYRARQQRNARPETHARSEPLRDVLVDLSPGDRSPLP